MNRWHASRSRRPGRSAILGSLLAIVTQTSGLAFANWSWGVPGNGFGTEGLEVVDLDGDGRLEILGATTWSNTAESRWMTLRVDGGLQVDFVSPTEATWFEQLRSVPSTEHAGADVVLFKRPNIEVADGRDGRTLRTIPTELDVVNGLEVVDLDADGFLEIVTCDSWSLAIYDYLSGALSAVYPQYGCGYLAVGQADLDPQLEIAIAGNALGGLVVDGSSLETQLFLPGELGSAVALADFDLDGISEIVDGYCLSGSICIRSAATGSILYEIPDAFAESVLAVDFQGDARPELVSSSYGRLTAVDVASGEVLWSEEGSGFMAPRIASGNLDGDAAIEIVWGVSGPISATDVYVYDTGKKAVEAVFESLDGPFYQVIPADVDGDGKLEIVAVSGTTNQGYESGQYVVLDPRDQEIVGWGPQPLWNNLEPLYSLIVADLDGDGALASCRGTDAFFVGRVVCSDFHSGVEEWTHDLPAGVGIRKMKAAKLRGDASLDIVVGTYAIHSGAPSIDVLALDGGTGNVLWRYIWPTWTFDGVSHLEVADVMGSPRPEVLAAAFAGTLVVLSADAGSVLAGPFALGLTALATSKFEFAPNARILVGTATGGLFALDPQNGTVTPLGAPVAGPIRGLETADLTFDGMPDLIYVANSRLTVRDGSTFADVWSSAPLASDAGTLDGLALGDFLGDGLLEIAVGSWKGVDVFDLSFAVVFRDGFESGSSCEWSSSEPSPGCAAAGG